MLTNYTADTAAHTLTAERTFNAPKSTVWMYFTSGELLDLWWGPQPYKAVTQSFDFSPGGHWKYIMQGPGGDSHHCINIYKEISPEDWYTAMDAFTDENWNINTSLPQQDWHFTFTQEGNVTKVTVVLSFQKPEDMDALIKMGFKEGFDIGLNQLETILAQSPQA